ncbi:MAG: hypothetical protein ACKO2N_07235, partial [Tabrizicola sp.]
MPSGEFVLIVPGTGDAARSETLRGMLAPVPPDPPEAEAWEVSFHSDNRSFNSGEPLLIRIPRSQPALDRSMARELRAAYEVLGWPGVANFGAGVFGLDAYTRFLKADGLDAKSFWGPAKGEDAIKKMDKAVHRDRRPMWDAYVKARKALDHDVAQMEHAITKAAHEVATARIARCRSLLIEEAQRYLSLGEPKAASARAVLVGGRDDQKAQGQVGLRGPDGAALRAAVQELAPLTAEVESAQSALLASKASDFVNQATGAVNPVALSLLTMYMPVLHAATKAAQFIAPDADATARAAARLSRASNAHQVEFVRLSGGHPVLFRLAGEDGLDERKATEAVVEVLQDAWSAARTMEEELAADATPRKSVVWTLPMLIDVTVRQRFTGDSAFAERAGADLLQARGAKIGPFALLNMFISGIDASLFLV